jgi:hypothetical protein
MNTMNTTNTTKTTSEQTADGEYRLRPLKAVNMADVVSRGFPDPLRLATCVNDAQSKQKYTTMRHNHSFLVIKTSEGGNPHVIAECYLEQVAAQICELLTAAADAALTLENAPGQK